MPGEMPRLKEIFVRALSCRAEGLIVKRLHAPYVPNYRGHWFKLKRDCMLSMLLPVVIDRFFRLDVPGLGDTFELCIVGGTYSSDRMALMFLVRFLSCRRCDNALGRLGGLLETLHLGALINSERVQLHGEAPLFRIVAAVQCGMCHRVNIEFCILLI